jgi:hypothetical protein
LLAFIQDCFTVGCSADVWERHDAKEVTDKPVCERRSMPAGGAGGLPLIDVMSFFTLERLFVPELPTLLLALLFWLAAD